MIGQPVAGLVQAQAAQEPLLVEVPAVGHAGVQAVAEEVVHLVDVDRAGEHAGEDLARPASRGFSLSRATTSRGLMPQSCRSTSPISPSSRKLLANSSWLGTLGSRMSSIGWQNGQWPRSCSSAAAMNTSASSRADGRGEPLVVGQLLQVQQGQAIHAQAVLEAGVDGRRIDQRHQAQAG